MIHKNNVDPKKQIKALDSTLPSEYIVTTPQPIDPSLVAGIPSGVEIVRGGDNFYRLIPAT